MKFNLITGKAGTGKSTFIFKKIKEIINEEKNIFIITPEQFSFTAEKRLLEEISSGAVINCEVLTFSRMAYRVINSGDAKEWSKERSRGTRFFDYKYTKD